MLIISFFLELITFNKRLGVSISLKNLTTTTLGEQPNMSEYIWD